MNPVALAFMSAFASGSLAFAVVFHGKRSIAHWLFAAGILLLGAERLTMALAVDALTFASHLSWLKLNLAAIAALPAIWVAFTLVYARGEWRAFLSAWKWLLFALALLPIVTALGVAGETISVRGTATAPEMVLGWPGKVVHVTAVAGFVLAVMNLERTFRASVGTIRWRIKFMIMGLGVVFAVYAYSSSQALLFSMYGTTLQIQTLNSAALLLGCLLIFRTLLRPGHFEVTVYPSLSLLHNSFTIPLAGVYLILIGVLAKIVSSLGGAAGFHTKALIVLVSLVLFTVVVMSDRVRLHFRRLVSHYFQRPLYDYRTVWRSFAEGTAQCLEESQLCNSVAKLVSEVFQCLSVTLWLVDERRETLTLAASTSVSANNTETQRLDGADAKELMKTIGTTAEPVDLDASSDFWAAALRRAHPDEFRKGGNRLCVPMIAGGELLGVITIGDRVGGVPFSLQDLDLLKSVSYQAAASLLNLQLAQKLSHAKQLEAFQAMSAFFVHDLKNTASTLSLMLQNLPVHYNDPKFREDALRGISKTVHHINDLISRLGLLRHDLGLKPADADLNDVVSEALKPHEMAGSVDIVKDLHPLPMVKLDASQMQKVVTNLVLNAKEALDGQGRISVATQRRDGWAVLAITDNGCGMSPEFINTRLFKPFQTTKKKGIGIGMFHCKAIVEAHRGRIEVESAPGQGATFRVLLPIPVTPG